MTEYHFRLSISTEKCLAYYEGAAQAVVVTLANGQNLQFPAESLRPFILRDGVHGAFVLRVNANNKLQALERVGD